MLLLHLLFGWFALVLVGIGILVALEPVWNRSATRPAPACPRRPTRLAPSGASAMQTAC
jgi:hypothetical protein